MACFGEELVVSPSNWWEVFSRATKNESSADLRRDSVAQRKLTAGSRDRVRLLARVAALMA
jgi:hypothetical protein